MKIGHLWYWTDAFKATRSIGKAVPVQVDPWDARVCYVLLIREWHQCVSKLANQLRGLTWRELENYYEEMALRAGGSPSGRECSARRPLIVAMLVGMGISSDTRKQIQSHGLGGVQQRHYDRHDYMHEKRRALEQWRKRLDQLPKRKPSSHGSRNKRAALQ